MFIDWAGAGRMLRGVGLRVGAALAMALAVLCSLGVSGAAAPQTHLLQSTFKPAEGFAPFGPHGIAVDQASGRVYVSDVGRGAVYRFDAGGSAGSPAKLTGPDGVTPAGFASPRGVAVDDSGGPGEGDVYVADGAAGTVRRFDPGGAETAWGPISALSVPLTGTPQAGGLADVVNDGAIAPNGLAVDSIGDVYVTDAENDVVDVFAPDGSFVRQLGAGSLSEPKWVAVAADGHVYVTNDSGLLELAPGGECVEACSSLDPAGVGGVASNGGYVYVSELGRIAELDAEGGWVGRFGEATARPRLNPLSFVEGIAVDSTSGDVYVLDLTPSAFGNAVAVFGPRVTVPGAETEAAAELTPVGATLEGSVEPEGVAVTECEFEYGTAGYERSLPCAESPASLGTGSAPVPVHADVDGLDPGTLYRFRLSAGNAIGAARFEGSLFSTPSAVAVEVEGPSEDGGRSVRLHARLGGRGVPLTDCAFEYLTAAAFEASGGSFAGAASAPCEPPAPSFPVDDAEHPVSAEATGLVGDTAYRFRVRAVSAYGTTAVEGPEFTTAQTPPIVATGEADEIAAESARLRGSVNPSGLPTTYYFEYGRTIAYGSRRPAGEGTAGGGHLPAELAATATGLQPSTAYHYRLVARNAIGGEAGADATFVTAPSTPQPPRAYELASPAAKYGAGVLADGGFQASPDGEAVTYLRATPDAPVAPRFVAYRGTGGWAERPVDAPEVSSVQAGPTEATAGLSADLRKAIVVSRKQLTADATKGDWNVYLRDLSSGAYEKLASADVAPHGEAAALEQLLAGGTPGFDHVVLRAAASFIEGAPPAALYDFYAGQSTSPPATPAKRRSKPTPTARRTAAA